MKKTRSSLTAFCGKRDFSLPHLHHLLLHRSRNYYLNCRLMMRMNRYWNWSYYVNHPNSHLLPLHQIYHPGQKILPRVDGACGVGNRQPCFHHTQCFLCQTTALVPHGLFLHMCHTLFCCGKRNHFPFSLCLCNQDKL